MFCSKCGATLNVDDKFCSKCGKAASIVAEQSVIANSAAVTPLTSFRNPTKLTTWLKYFLYTSIIIDAIALFSYVLQYQLLLDYTLDAYSLEAWVAAAASTDKRQQIIMVLQFGVTLITVMLFAMWIYRANFNSRALGAQNMKFTPGWSVGYYFIPFLNLWYPYQAMKEIWKTSKNPTAWENEKRGAILPWWWLFFLANNLLGNVLFKASMDANDINSIISVTKITIIFDMMNILSGLIAIVLVGKVYEMQIIKFVELENHNS